jgi:hypothetical protein
MNNEEVDLFAGGNVGVIEQVRLKAAWNPVKAVRLVIKKHGESEEYDFVLQAHAKNEWVYAVHHQAKKQLAGGGESSKGQLYNTFLGVLTFVCMTSVVVLHQSTRGKSKQVGVEEDTTEEAQSFVPASSKRSSQGGQYQNSGGYGSHEQDYSGAASPDYSGGGYGNQASDPYDNGFGDGGQESYDTGFDSGPSYGDYDDGSASPDYTADRYETSKSRLDVV